MTTWSIRQSIRIQARPRAVWSALVEPAKLALWMGGARVESTWQPGSDITFTGSLLGHPYRDRGTILVYERERVLRYNHWSALARRADTEGTRTVVTLTLTPDGDATELEITHDNLVGHSAFGHARFFWRGALTDVKRIAEAPDFR